MYGVKSAVVAAAAVVDAAFADDADTAALEAGQSLFPVHPAPLHQK